METIKKIRYQLQVRIEYLLGAIIIDRSMKKFFGFLMGKIDNSSLHFHYLRVGNSTPILDQLREITKEIEDVKWVQHESDSYGEYHFGTTYGNYDGAIINYDIKEDNLQNNRKDFWENFIFKTRDHPIPLAILVPSSDQFGTLTIPQIYEALSLVRLTDRPFKIFEYSDTVDDEIVTWLSKICSLVHRKTKEESAN